MLVHALLLSAITTRAQTPHTAVRSSAEVIADMLGVRREGVTEGAGRLQRAGLLDCQRGHITVRNRQGLEAWTCECYRGAQTEYDRLLPYLQKH